jgi:hypothetical protein
MTTIGMTPYQIQLRQDVLDAKYRIPKEWTTDVDQLNECHDKNHTFQKAPRGNCKVLRIQIYDRDKQNRKGYKIDDTAAHRALDEMVDDDAFDPPLHMKIMHRAMSEEAVRHRGNVGGSAQYQPKTLWDITCKRLDEDQGFLERVTKE